MGVGIQLDATLMIYLRCHHVSTHEQLVLSSSAQVIDSTSPSQEEPPQHRALEPCLPLVLWSSQHNNNEHHHHQPYLLRLLKIKLGIEAWAVGGTSNRGEQHGFFFLFSRTHESHSLLGVR